MTKEKKERLIKVLIALKKELDSHKDWPEQTRYERGIGYTDAIDLIQDDDALDETERWLEKDGWL